MKEVRSKGTLQKSLKLTPKALTKNIENNSSSNSGVNKAFVNIEKTKKLIKNMRNEMNEFSIKHEHSKNIRDSRKTNSEV